MFFSFVLFCTVATIIEKKSVEDDLMVVPEFAPPLHLFNVDKGHVVNFLVAHLNIVWLGVGRNIGSRRLQATCTLLLERQVLTLK